MNGLYCNFISSCKAGRKVSKHLIMRLIQETCTLNSKRQMAIPTDMLGLNSSDLPVLFLLFSTAKIRMKNGP